MSDTALSLAPTLSGCLVRVEGRASIADAAAVRSLIDRRLQESGDMVVLDLAECSHLDSTFLGTLVALHQQHNREGAARFLIYLPEEDRKRLFGCCRLDTFLRFAETAPELAGPAIAMDAPQLRVDEFGHMVMESHERLAELGGKNAEAFRRVADRIALELSRAK